MQQRATTGVRSAAVAETIEDRDVLTQALATASAAVQSLAVKVPYNAGHKWTGVHVSFT